MQSLTSNSRDATESSLISGVIEDYTRESRKTQKNELQNHEITETHQNIEGIVDEFNSNQQISNLQQAISSSSYPSRTFLLELISRLSGWLFNSNNPTNGDHPLPAEDIWQDWEWVLSKAEEISQKHSQEEAEMIRKELRRLRQTANALKYRPFFHLASKDAFRKLTESEILDLNSVLQAAESYKIITDVINSLEDEWLRFIQNTFFPDPENISWQIFSANYKEKPYEKNITGALKELAFSASHGPKNVGINQKVLSDIMWSLWKTLTTSIRTGVNRDLTKEELILVAKEVVKAQQPFIKLWIQTVRNSRLGKSKEGKLIKKWELETKDLEQKLTSIKQKGVDAKYEYHTYTPVVATEDRSRELKGIRALMENKLSTIYAH